MNDELKNISREELQIAQILCFKQVENLANEKVKPVRDEFYRLVKTSDDDLLKKAAYDRLDSVLDDFDSDKARLWTAAVDLYRQVRDGKASIAGKFPDGVVLTSQCVGFDTLKIYCHYPAERTITGVAGRPGTYTPVPHIMLHTEVRLSPSQLSLLSPDSSLYYNTDLAGRGGLDTEQIETLVCLHTCPDITDSILNASLQDENDFLQCLYVEGIQMARVRSVMFQHPDISQHDLQQALQLLRIKDAGVRVIDDGVALTGVASNMSASVTRDFCRMYTGEGRELSSHPDYLTDIRPLYDAALKARAEYELRRMGIILTLPECYDIRWKNTSGNHSECREMTRTLNDMFRGYTDKILQARQDGDHTYLDVFTTDLINRQRIIDTVTKSWAVDEIQRITGPWQTDYANLPQEIAAAWQAEIDRRESRLLAYYVGFDQAYFYEEGTDGYVRVSHDRTVHPFGEELTPAHRDLIDQIVSSRNIVRSGTCILRPCGPERQYIDLADGTVLRVNVETLDDNRTITVDHNDRTRRDVSSARFVDITGRLTDATLVRRGDDLWVRCRIDGEPQMARRLTRTEQAYALHDATALAYRHFVTDLMDNLDRQKGLGR